MFQILAASLILGSLTAQSPPTDPAKPPVQVRKYQLTARSAKELYGDLAGLQLGGITYMSYDPTDNSLVFQGTEAGLDSISKAVTAFDHKFETAWVLSARKTFADDAFVTSDGPTHFDAGDDSMSLFPGSLLTVRFPAKNARTAYQMLLYGIAEKGTELRLGQGSNFEVNWSDPSSAGQPVTIHMFVSTSKSDSLLQATCKVKGGQFKVKRIVIAGG